MDLSFKLWRLFSLLLIILDDNFTEEGWRWFRLSIRVCQKTTLDIHPRYYYKSRCYFARV